MKILFINAVCGTGSTGKICAEAAQQYEAEGHEVKIAYGRHAFVPEKYRKYAVRIGTDADVRRHALYTRLTDRHGLASKKATREFLQWAEAYSPDVVWLHNLHGYYINYEMLFAWIKRHPAMKVKWTLHDCWAFTGHCAHFTAVNCSQWQQQCRKCPQIRTYPASALVSSCRDNFSRKQKAFTGVSDMTLITPSRWLAELVKKSFLKDYPVTVIPNTIDTEIFKPTPGTFRQSRGLEDKRIILGVASTWNDLKGWSDFMKLSGLLDQRYVIVLVGLSEKQMKHLPANVIGIRRTEGQKELAELYTAADVFVNLTYEDTYPTVNLEAQACRTPCITYRTGGSVESVKPENIVEVGDIAGLYRKIKDCCSE